ncbi:MAG TPA: hybrid sensor histidine kinase/response regulator, partial [Ramlibacter sp.]
MPRDAGAVLRSLRALAILSVILPLFIFSVFGAFRYAEAMQNADQRVTRSLRVSHEHAVRVLAGAESMQDRVLELVRGRNAAELRADEARLHQTFRRWMDGQKQLQSIWVIGPDGKPLASSVGFPAPAIEVSDRPYFHFHRAGSTTRYWSEPLVTRVAKDKIIDLSLRFDGADGGFGGVVNVSLHTSYFEQFYTDLVANEPGLAVNMFRRDGPIYVRWPAVPGLPDRLGKSSPVLTRVMAGENAGRLTGVSSVDGQERLLAFTRVGDSPLFLGAGMNLSEVRWQLARELGIFLLVGL